MILFNKMFGWDYISFRYQYSTYTRRVIITNTGKRLVKVEGEYLVLLNDNTFENNPNNFTPLTF